MNPRSRRIVWITGASSGIGRSLAASFAFHGDHVMATARSLNSLRQLKRTIEAGGGLCDVARMDVRTERDVLRMSKTILKKAGRIDILVNNAGVTYFKDFLATSVKEFDHVIGTNLRGMFLASKSVLPSMVKRKAGLVVNVLSFAAKTIYTKSAAYSASKSGAEAMMNVLRAELRMHGIKVMNVYPGAVLTPMWSASQRRKFSERMVKPEDIANIVLEATLQKPSVMVEEIVIRPQKGDV